MAAGPASTTARLLPASFSSSRAAYPGRCSPKRWAADLDLPAGGACATGRRRACGKSCIRRSWTGSGRPTGSTGSGLLWTRQACRPKGGQRTGPNPTDKAKAGSKRHVVSDRGGIPLAVVLSAANVHDSKVLVEAVDAISPIRKPRGRPGRPRKRPAKLHADKAYDFPRCRQALRKRGITPRISRRGIDSSEKLGRHRWVVERTLAWLSRYRRLSVRYERRDDIHEAFLHLGCSLICLNYLK